MLDLFKRLTGQTGNEPLVQADERAAVATILVEAAHADGAYDASESAHIARILATRYGVSETEAAVLRSEGERAHAEAVDLVRFTRAVKGAVAHEDREAGLARQRVAVRLGLE